MKVTDPFGLSAEVPFRLVEKNMTWEILLIALAVILLIVLVFFRVYKTKGKNK